MELKTMRFLRLIIFLIFVSLSSGRVLAIQVNGSGTDSSKPSLDITTLPYLSQKELLENQTLQKQAKEVAILEAKKIQQPQDIGPETKPTQTANGHSSIEAVFSDKFPRSIPRGLKQFGYDVFGQTPSNFTPLGDIPVASDYIVGPGDTFTINIWGNTNLSYSVSVKRNGTIFIPKVGPIKVWGLSYGKMKRRIRARLSNFFSGFKMSITFETIRTVSVFIIGEVTTPGFYTIPSTSTVINALFKCGGVTKRGSLRNIEIHRNNKRIATVDLYEFLISGKAPSNYRLQSEDIILIPVIGSVTGIAGSVKRPAIYELKKKTSIYDLYTMAGGITFTGHVGRIQLERVLNNKKRITQDFEMPLKIKTMKPKAIAKTDMGKRVRDGDLIKIFPILPGLKQTVFLEGHVARPGPYELKKDMLLSSLIPNHQALLPEAYLGFVQIKRILEPDQHVEFLFSNLERLFDGDDSQDIELHEQDTITVFSKQALNLKEKVHIRGQVNKPGDYPYFKGMTLKDLIQLAGNITQSAYLANAEIARYIPMKDELKAERMTVDLNDVLRDNPVSNPPLLPKDRVYVRSLPEWELNNFITLTGEIKFPGPYAFTKGERLSNVIERAGGYTWKAFLPGTVFTRVSVQKLQQEKLNKQIEDLQQAILSEDLYESAQALSAEAVQTQRQARASRNAMLANLKRTKATGRMVIRLDTPKNFKGSDSDIRLEAGDALSIPAIPSVVTVMGEVYNPTSIVYKPGKSVRHYLELVGGPTVNANTQSIFIIKADGTVVSRKQNRGFLLRNFYNKNVERGDTILVPKDITRFSWLNTTKDITEILFRIASTTGITIAAFK